MELVLLPQCFLCEPKQVRALEDAVSPSPMREIPDKLRDLGVPRQHHPFVKKGIKSRWIVSRLPSSPSPA